MSSDTCKAHGSHGSWDGLNIDPRNPRIAEDDPEHPAYARHAKRSIIKRSLVRDIKKRGVVIPVHLWMDGETSTVGAGRRRIRHACVAAEEMEADGLIYTPAEWFDMTKEEQKAALKKGPKGPPLMVRAVMVKGSPKDTETAENANREDESPMAKANLLSEALSRCDNMEQAMDLCGIEDARTGNAYLLLIKACPNLQTAVDNGEVTMATCIESKILKQSHKEQEETLAYYRAAVAQARADAGGKAVKGVKASAIMTASVEGLDVAEIKERVASTTAVRFASKSTILALREKSSTLTGDARALLNWITGVAGAIDASPKLKAILAEIKAEKPKKTRGPNKVKATIADDAANDTEEEEVEDVDSEEEEADAAE